MATAAEKAKILARLGGFPQEPRFRQESLSRDPEIKEWQRQFDIWWQELKKLLEEAKSSADTSLSAHALSNSDSFTKIQTQLKTLSDSLDLIYVRVGGHDDDIALIQSTLISLQSQIDALNVASHYTHTQLSPASVWNINHGMGRTPSISVFNGAGVRMIAKEEALDSNNSRITFNGTYSGRAECT